VASNRGWHYGWGGDLAQGERGLVLSLITARTKASSTPWSTNSPQLPGHDHRQTVLMNPEDLAPSSLTSHQRVTMQVGIGSNKFESVLAACKQRR
jgi:hypothetical protein